jgi:hypothetical protein
MPSRQEVTVERQISESDWKLLRRLEPVALERFCRAALSELVRLASDPAKGSHARYLGVFARLREQDEELGDAFNDLKRSTAYLKLARMRSFGLLTDEEFAGFGPQTQAAVALFLDMWGADPTPH